MAGVVTASARRPRAGSLLGHRHRVRIAADRVAPQPRREPVLEALAQDGAGDRAGARLAAGQRRLVEPERAPGQGDGSSRGAATRRHPAIVHANYFRPRMKALPLKPT